MRLHEVLGHKGTEVHTILPEDTMARVVELMVERNCGSLVVVNPESKDQLVGIITERDIMKGIAAGKKLQATQVKELMTSKVHTGHTKDKVADTMGLMTEKRIRHLPIIEENRLAGMISIGDVVKAQYDALSAENHHLKNYIQS